MFPSELSTGICSLKPHVDRLVQSCLMEVDGKGTVVRYELHDGVIHSNARMTYNEVHAILTARDPVTRAAIPARAAVRNDARAVPDPEPAAAPPRLDRLRPEGTGDRAGRRGLVEAIIAAERNVAHRIIEEFMLLANETVAQHLDDNDVPTLYRIHEEPDPLKVEEFEEFVTTLGYSIGAPPEHVKPRHFQKLVEKMRGTPEEKPIAFLMLRTMQKARYDPQNLGHFGLAAESYTHFTSPIRRYPDLVVHRTLRESRQDRMTADRRDELTEDLPEIARHTSDRERRADEAERELVQWKKVRFMADKVGDEFEGYITGVTAFGLFIELVEHFVEGLVHISTMADDYYRFIEKAHVLREKRPEGCSGWATRSRCRSSRSTWSDARWTSGWPRSSTGSERRKAIAAHGIVASSRASRRAASTGKRRPRSERPRRRPASARVPVGRNAQSRRAPLKSVVVGTAGHIDHGKSALVRALTGPIRIG